MLTVLVGNIKGGCGKTTIATHLAVAFALSGMATSLADCDRQRSSLNWLRRRGDRVPLIRGLDWSRGIDETAGTADRLVIDAPAAMRHKAVEELIAIADIVVIPVLPGAFDEDASAYFLKKLGEVKAVRKHKRVVAVVGNRLRANTRASIHLDRFFEGLGFPVITRLRDSQTYPMLAAEGGTVLDSRDRRAREHAADWQPLLRLIGIDS